MIGRAILYVSIAAAIIAGAVYLNRDKSDEVVRFHVDAEAAMSEPSHNHAITATACECDPEEEIKQAMADRANYSRSHQELADGFYARARYEEAERCYRRAVEQDATNAPAHFGLGMVYLKTGRFDEARTSFQKAVEIDRRMVKGYVEIGLTHYCEGDFTRAQKQWEAALKIDPEHKYAKALLKSLPEVDARS